MKYEWRKQDKTIYLPKTKPEIIELKEYPFFTIHGKGNPNTETFQTCVETLYSMSYYIRMAPKKGIEIKDYFEYTVFPLEGIWDLDEEGRKLDHLDKDHLVYTLMIRQPEFITKELFEMAQIATYKNKPNLRAIDAKLEYITEGKCVQMMHIGSYDDEPKTFELMEQFTKENNLTRESKIHKEIYISDPRKTNPEDMKTVLRFNVK